MKKQKIILVTGKMASGKNMASSILEKMGFASVDADFLVHRAIEISSQKITETFSDEAEKRGIELKNTDGSLNRRAIGQIVFSSPALLEKQEKIVFPVVARLTEEFVAENPEKDIAINATVAYKTPEILKFCSNIIFVDSPAMLRLARAKKRDGMKITHILQRFNAQKNLLVEYKKTGVPLTLVRNTGSVKKLEQRIRDFLRTTFNT